MASTTRILIADDQPDVLEALQLLLKAERLPSRHLQLTGQRLVSLAVEALRRAARVDPLVALRQQ